MDDIESLSALAKRYNVGLHVDCCLGSFIVPFLMKAGFEMPVFDFRLEGVTAISCDTHKVNHQFIFIFLFWVGTYVFELLHSMVLRQRFVKTSFTRGNIPIPGCYQGSSVIMYRNAELRRHQYYVTSTWPGKYYLSFLTSHDEAGFARRQTAMVTLTFVLIFITLHDIHPFLYSISRAAYPTWVRF